MATVEMKPMGGRKKIIPLVMALGNKILNSLGFAEKIDEKVEWDASQWAVSPGKLIKALALSTFADMKTPLTRLQDRLAGIDLRYLIGEEAATNGVNSFNVGRALGRLGKSDTDGLYETLALTALKTNGIPIGRSHSDTTTLSFYGEYDIDMDRMDLTEEEKAEVLKIEQGYNKDGRPGCSQVVLGQIVTESGIAFASRAMDGATSDVEWNKDAIKLLRRIQEEGFSTGIYVADCKAVFSELVSDMSGGERPIQFVSRCPASFEEKLESRMTERAYAAGGWQEYGHFGKGARASSYRGVSFTENVCSHPMRLLVVESSSLAGKADAAIGRKMDALVPLAGKLEKNTYACHADALAACAEFFGDRRARLFSAATRIDKTTKERWPRGRRKAGAVPVIEETFKIVVEKIQRNEDACRVFMQNESSFVIISNVLDGLSDKDLLATYKGQQIVENSFRLLKGPQLASVIYLKNPVRIKALTMVLSVALLVRAIIQFKLREGLREFKEKHPGGKLFAGWNGRALANPTYRLLYEHAFDCHFEREDYGKYSFAWPYVESKERVGTLLWLMGLDVLDLIE